MQIPAAPPLGAQLGRQGAEVIYPAMFHVLVEQAYPAMILRYAELLKAPAKIAEELAASAQLAEFSSELWLDESQTRSRRRRSP